MSLLPSVRRCQSLLHCAVLAGLMLGGLAVHTARADELYINEIHFDPNGSPDDNEFIELRGTHDLDLSDCYLVFLENEKPNGVAQPGYGFVEAVFDLGSMVSTDGNSTGVLGSASGDGYGYAVIRGKECAAIALDASAIDYQNQGTGAGFGYDGSGGTSTIGFSQIISENGSEGHIENSGFTALLIHVEAASTVVPTVGDNYDGTDGDGKPMLVLADNDNWDVLDSVGVQAESDETDGRLYGAINFGATISGVHSAVPAGTVFVSTNTGTGSVSTLTEIEYVGRWGDGNHTDFSDPDHPEYRDDWWVANLKKDAPSPSFRLDFASAVPQGIRGNYTPVDAAHGGYYDTSTHYVVTDTYGSENHD